MPQRPDTQRGLQPANCRAKCDVFCIPHVPAASAHMNRGDVLEEAVWVFGRMLRRRQMSRCEPSVVWVCVLRVEGVLSGQQVHG